MNPSPLPEPKFLSVPEAGRICGVSRNTVYTWVRNGKLSAYQTPGKTNLIRPGDLVTFMNGHGMFVPASLNRLAEEDNQLMGARSAEAEGASPADAAILVVDDDPMSRSVAVRALKDLAPIYQAGTGYEALHLVTLHPDIRLMLLDLRMPGQHGLETLREIRKLRPHLLVIVVSGFAGDLPMQEPEVRDMVYQIVEKPISLQGLLEITTRAMGLLRR